MIKLITILMLMLTCSNIIGQDTYRKKYRVPYRIEYKERNQTIIEKEKEENGEKEIKKRLKTDNRIVAKNNSTLVLQVYDKKGSKIDRIVIELAEKRMWANVVFSEEQNEDNILLINPWLINDGSGRYVKREVIYCFKLENRQVVKLDFRQWNLNALSIPLKMRFSKDVATEFSSDANLGAVFGYTWGSTKFVYRKGIGNKQYDRKFTAGLFLGAGKIEFSFENDLEKKVSVNNGLLSTGIALLRSYQNFTYGITGGLDFSLGENSSKWDFQGNPWLGVSLGYSLFSF